jgi:hypothetical protein
MLSTQQNRTRLTQLMVVLQQLAEQWRRFASSNYQANLLSHLNELGVFKLSNMLLPALVLRVLLRHFARI